MTGYYVRSEMDGGGYKTKELTELSDTELIRFFDTVDVKMARKWAIALVKWIKEHVKDGSE